MGIIDWALGKFGYTKLNKETVPAGTIEKEFGVQPAASQKMTDNVNLWYAMYINHPPWETCDVRPLGLPGSIGRELSRHALTEFSVTVSGGTRADYINKQLQAAVPQFGNNLEMGLCLGGVALKPYPDYSKGRVLVAVYTTDFSPTRFDGAGKCIGGVFKSEPVRQGKDWYIKLEYHDFLQREDGSTVYVVENKVFRSGKDRGIGSPVSLSTVPEWAELEEHAEIENLDGPLFAYFKPPMANQEEPGSPIGVSVYSGATVDLIRQADKQWEQLLWIFKVAEPKIFSDGIAKPEQVSDRIFIGGSFTSAANLFQIFDPEVKDSAYYRGFQYILQRIEYNVGLSFGTISDPQSVEKTATEILSAKQRQYVTEGSIQQAFQATLDDLIYAMWALCDLDRLAPAGDYEVDYNWGDGVLDDPETRRQDMAMDATLVNQQLMSRKQFIMKWQKVDEETAETILAKIDDIDEIVTEEQEEIE